MPQKKKLKEAQSDSEESEKCPSNLGEVDITFTGRFIETIDSDGIQRLLFQLFRSESVDIREMTNLIIDQFHIGSVLKEDFDDSDMEDDDDETVVFGVTTLLNLTKNKEKACIKQLFELLKKSAGDKNIQQKLEAILTEPNKLGLLINERFENLPAKISLPMFTMLLKEVEREKKKDSSFDFNYCILISKMYKEENDKFYINQEDPYFVKNAILSFDFQVKSSYDASVDANNAGAYYRKLTIFNASKLPEIVDNVGKEFS